MTQEQELALARLDAQLDRITRAHPDLDGLITRLHLVAIIAQARDKHESFPIRAEGVELGVDELTLVTLSLTDIGDALRLPPTDSTPKLLSA